MLDWRTLVAVALGGSIGSVLRYAVGFAVAQRWGAGFPWGTLLINVTGSLVIGFVAEISQTTAFGITPLARVFMTVGVLGGYTTFSSFAYDSITLAREGAAPLSLGYVLGTVVLGICAAYAGMLAARLLAAAH